MALSEQEILRNPEYRKIARDILYKHLKDRRWRLNNLYRIVNAAGQDIQFCLNFAQTLLYLSLWYFNVVLKSRQHGITTFACILFLDICLFNSNINAAIIAHNKEDAEEFFEKNIKYAYESLPAEIKDLNPATQDSRRKLKFKNGSSIRVTTSGRSGTFQLLHVSELGKIAARYPEKAREIKTGSLNAIHPGQLVIIESTAEGREGLFFDLCEMSRKLAESKSKLTPLDPKFHFFNWLQNPLNSIDPTDVVILDYQKKYFDELKYKHKLNIRPDQMAWYVKKWEIQGDDMKGEHPSTPEEAFLSSVIGAYFRTQFDKIYRDGRITKVPHQPGILVDTWWDIGMDDSTSIWFTQNVGREIHVIDYYENNGEGYEHYKGVLDQKTNERGFQYGVHGAPHDISVREWFLQGKSRLEAAAASGIKFETAPRLTDEAGIEQIRRLLNICIFDEEHCSMKFGGNTVGIESLENFRKEWNDKLQTYRNKYLHDWASHGAKAFQTMATLHKFGNIIAIPNHASSVSSDIKNSLGNNIHNAGKRAGGWT